MAECDPKSEIRKREKAISLTVFLIAALLIIFLDSLSSTWLMLGMLLGGVLGWIDRGHSGVGWIDRGREAGRENDNAEG